MGTAAASQSRHEKRAELSHSDRYFFSGMAVLIVAAVFWGFARTYFLAGVFRAKLPSALVHVHAAVFILWIALLVTQVILVSSRHVRWHMRLGILGMFLAPLMLITGSATLVGAIKRGFVPSPALQIITAAEIFNLCSFAGLICWAFMARRNPTTHKRLVLFATFFVMAPAIGRLATSPAQFFLVMYCFAGLLVIYDLWTDRSVHRATIVGLSLLIVQHLATPLLAQSVLMNHLIAAIQKR